MMNAVAYDTDSSVNGKPDDLTGGQIKQENEMPIDSVDATVEADSLRYVTKLIDNIEALNKDPNLQLAKKERSIAQEPRSEENK